MLESLHIENIAVIEKASLEFDAGLNILTGETGAGKSIIIDSINAILGERTTRDLVRSGAANGTVTALFTGIDREVTEKLRSLDLPVEEDGSLLVSRRISVDGKNACKINGQGVTATVLKEIGRLLINIHGQHDSQALLNPDQHYRFIDMMLPQPQVYDAYLASFRRLIEVRRKLKSLSMDEAEKEERVELLRYQIREMEEAAVRKGEREQLQQRRERITNSESILSALHSALQYIDGADDFPGALAAFSGACSEVESVSRFDPHLAEQLPQMYDTLYAIESYKDMLRASLEQVEFDPNELEEIGMRLDLLHRLCGKYGGTEDAVLETLCRAKEELAQIVTADEQLERLEQACGQLLKETVQLADRLSEERRQTAHRFEKQVKAELAFLDMPGLDFQVHFEKGKLNHLGYDKISFLISTNPGEPLKGLNKIASGGELSRIMLAFKNILASNDHIGTLIFDEIDTGVSGHASQKIGSKLKSVSRSCQVLCVTHSAQIASFASRHLLISKQVREQRTYTEVQALDLAQRAEELARIMGGNQRSETLLASAKEMLDKNLEEK